jgi:hypothetical protein
MIIPASEFLPEIDWEFGELLEKDIDERMEVFIATGFDKEGYTYEGEAYFFGGEFEEVKDVIKISQPQN